MTRRRFRLRRSFFQRFAVEFAIEQENEEVDVDFGFLENVEHRHAFELHLQQVLHFNSFNAMIIKLFFNRSKNKLK